MQSAPSRESSFPPHRLSGQWDERVPMDNSGECVAHKALIKGCIKTCDANTRKKSNAGRIKHLQTEHDGKHVDQLMKKDARRRTIRQDEPKALVVMFGLNFARTMPEFPCVRVIFLHGQIYRSQSTAPSAVSRPKTNPQITRCLVPRFSVFALYT